MSRLPYREVYSVPLSVFSAFQKERPSAGFPMSMGSSASSFGTMGEVSIRMRRVRSLTGSTVNVSCGLLS